MSAHAPNARATVQTSALQQPALRGWPLLRASPRSMPAPGAGPATDGNARPGCAMSPTQAWILRSRLLQLAPRVSVGCSCFGERLEGA